MFICCWSCRAHSCFLRAVLPHRPRFALGHWLVPTQSASSPAQSRRAPMGVSAPKQQSEVSRKRAGLDATAGALAGAVSRLVVGPLDVVKIRMQVQLEPVRRGALSKYTGVGQALKRILVEEGVTVRSGPCTGCAQPKPYCRSCQRHHDL